MKEYKNFVGYKLWNDSYEILNAQIKQIDNNMHFNSLNLQYFKSLDLKYIEFVKSKEFYDKYIDNYLFYGLEDVVFNKIYYIPKNRFSNRKMAYNSFVVRMINNAIGLYLYKVSEKFITEFVDNNNSNIFSRYGGKIQYTEKNKKISIKEDNLWYKMHYKEFTKKMIACIDEKEKYRIILKLDIQDFFENIKVKDFLTILENKLGYAEKEKYEYDKIKIENISDYYKFIMNGQEGIPQSDNDIVTSFISSLYMKLIDVDIISIIQNLKIDNLKNYKILQYCDDTYLVLDFYEKNENKIYNVINQILQELSLKLVKKYNLKFNKKSKIFDLSFEANIQDLKKNIKINSQVEIELERGEKPQNIFDDIILKINDFSNQGINDADEEVMLESLKRIYNSSVKMIINKEKNLKALEDTILKSDLNKFLLSIKYIVTLACKNEKTKEKILEYIKDISNKSITKFYYVLEYICKNDIGYLDQIDSLNLEEDEKNILKFKKISKNSLGYMMLNADQFEYINVNDSKIIKQIKYRRINEVSQNYNIAFNHLVNEVKSILNMAYSNDIDEKNYTAKNIKEDLKNNNYNINTIIVICNMFERRNNNMISHSNGKIIEKDEYFLYKKQVCNLLYEMIEKNKAIVK